MEGLAYCKVPVSPVRASASDRAEMVTQLLYSVKCWKCWGTISNGCTFAPTWIITKGGLMASKCDLSVKKK